MSNSESLFDSSVKGVAWLGSTQILGQATHFGIRLVLARLLLPDAFGLIAVAMLGVHLAELASDLGFGSALVQRRDLQESHKATAFWSNILAGCLLFFSLSSAAPLIARFFHQPELTPLIVALSVSVVIQAPQTTLQNLFVRELRYDIVGSNRLFSIAIGGVVGIGFAALGLGPWALASEALSRSSTATVLYFLRSPWRPTLLFDRSAFSELWNYSQYLIGARFANFFNRNADTLLIGRFLDPTSLGYYNLGYQLVLLPLIYFTRPLAAVLFATLSRVSSDRRRMQKGYLHAVAVVSLITFPIMTLLALVAPALIPSVLGQKWQPAAALFPFLCVVGLVQSVQNLIPAVFRATGRTDYVLRMALTSSVLNFIAFSLGLRWGIMGVAVAYACASLLVAPVLQIWLVSLLGISWKSLADSVKLPFLATVALAATWYLTGAALGATGVNWSIFAMTTVRCLAAAAVYTLISWYFNPSVNQIMTRISISGPSKFNNVSSSS